jgi:hypothetical protein
MKKLLVLLFILYHFPAKAVTIDLVCLDHVKQTATVYHNVQAPDDYKYLSMQEIRSILCKRLKQLKRGN